MTNKTVSYEVDTNQSDVVWIGRKVTGEHTGHIKLADGKLEPRQVVIGVTDRVRGEVLEGLKEGEQVIVGKRETTPQTGPTAGNNNNNNNNNFRPNQGFPGGGNFRPF